jgi:hypothetical protein
LDALLRMKQQLWWGDPKCGRPAPDQSGITHFKVHIAEVVGIVIILLQSTPVLL